MLDKTVKIIMHIIPVFRYFTPLSTLIRPYQTRSNPLMNAHSMRSLYGHNRVYILFRLLNEGPYHRRPHRPPCKFHHPMQFLKEIIGTLSYMVNVAFKISAIAIWAAQCVQGFQGYVPICPDTSHPVTPSSL